MHYRRKVRVTEKSCVFLIPKSIEEKIAFLASFQGQSFSKIVESALLFQSFKTKGGINEISYTKAKKYYKTRKKIQPSQNGAKRICETISQEQAVQKSLFE